MIKIIALSLAFAFASYHLGWQHGTKQEQQRQQSALLKKDVQTYQQLIHSFHAQNQHYQHHAKNHAKQLHAQRQTIQRAQKSAQKSAQQRTLSPTCRLDSLSLQHLNTAIKTTHPAP